MTETSDLQRHQAMFAAFIKAFGYGIIGVTILLAGMALFLVN
jgi:hypothetical protein